MAILTMSKDITTGLQFIGNDISVVKPYARVGKCGQVQDSIWGRNSFTGNARKDKNGEINSGWLLDTRPISYTTWRCYTWSLIYSGKINLICLNVCRKLGLRIAFCRYTVFLCWTTLINFLPIWKIDFLQDTILSFIMDKIEINGSYNWSILFSLKGFLMHDTEKNTYRCSWATQNTEERKISRVIIMKEWIQPVSNVPSQPSILHKYVFLMWDKIWTLKIWTYIDYSFDYCFAIRTIVSTYKLLKCGHLCYITFELTASQPKIDYVLLSMNILLPPLSLTFY